MIGFLRGILVHRDPPRLVLDVGGVGYEVEVPMSTWARLPALGAEVQLCTHLVIREDQHLLFGFGTETERGLFRDLLRVNGVGARIALGVLSGISVGEFVRCVQTNDVAALVKLPGVGRRTAERLVIELRERVEAMAEAGLVSAVRPAAGERAASSPEHEALDALLGLGYRPAEARRMIEQARPEGANTEDLLRAALKAAAPQGRG
jgi:Holliday junction DNA helicase RuvA